MTTSVGLLPSFCDFFTSSTGSLKDQRLLPFSFQPDHSKSYHASRVPYILKLQADAVWSSINEEVSTHLHFVVAYLFNRPLLIQNRLSERPAQGFLQPGIYRGISKRINKTARRHCRSIQVRKSSRRSRIQKDNSYSRFSSQRISLSDISIVIPRSKMASTHHLCFSNSASSSKRAHNGSSASVSRTSSQLKSKTSSSKSKSKSSHSYAKKEEKEERLNRYVHDERDFRSYAVKEYDALQEDARRKHKKEIREVLRGVKELK